ncbi:UNVERIFIED_CONTAM: Cytochrome c oxidase copper chaperone [Trichonephila clavipes]
MPNEKEEPKKLKPCCACPETRKARDACFLDNAAQAETVTGASNSKTGYRSGTICCLFRQVPILCAVLVSVVFKETTRCLLPFDIGIRALELVRWLGQLFLIHTSLAWIDHNLNADWYIFDILHPVVMPYHRVLSNTLYQQDNARQGFLS